MVCATTSFSSRFEDSGIDHGLQIPARGEVGNRVAIGQLNNMGVDRPAKSTASGGIGQRTGCPVRQAVAVDELGDAVVKVFGLIDAPSAASTLVDSGL